MGPRTTSAEHAPAASTGAEVLPASAVPASSTATAPASTAEDISVGAAASSRRERLVTHQPRAKCCTQNAPQYESGVGSRSMRRWGWNTVASAACIAGLGACEAILGVGDLHDDGPAGPDASADSASPDAGGVYIMENFEDTGQ